MSQQHYGFIVDDVRSKHLCGFARVVFQEPPEPFPALDRACTLCVWAARREEQHIIPTTSLECIDQICARRITALWSQATIENSFLHVRKSLC